MLNLRNDLGFIKFKSDLGFSILIKKQDSNQVSGFLKIECKKTILNFEIENMGYKDSDSSYNLLFYINWKDNPCSGLRYTIFTGKLLYHKSGKIELDLNWVFILNEQSKKFTTGKCKMFNCKTSITNSTEKNTPHPFD